ncbi:MAG: hypothetical protein HQL57_06480 [Magnetococcales bacterium]|nr:hypothetical protein [Magnetococcales bacterium]MBF0156816.1 hypothetical protein [Magnetococcales bacterium]
MREHGGGAAGSGAWGIIGFLVVFLGVSGVFLPWLGEAVAAGEGQGLVIVSDRLEVDDKKHEVLFSGKVRAEEKGLLLTAERMTVHYDSTRSRQGSRNRVQRILAQGGVRFAHGRHRGSGDEALYRMQDGTVELKGIQGMARVERGEDVLEGKRILVYLDAERRVTRVSVLGEEGKRVSARISPDGEVVQGLSGGSATGSPKSRGEGAGE